MPSPFPGMDPYLEGEWSTSFQPMFMSEICRRLNKELRSSYVALPTRRVVRGTFENPAGGPSIPASIPHVWIRIVRPRDRRPVTVIEFLTPTNKRGVGRMEYASRRTDFLRRGVHLVEIDLDRLDERIPTAHPLPEASYFVYVTHHEGNTTTEVWPIALSEALPIIPIPLLPDDADAMLDLQAVMDTAFDDGAFVHAIDYRMCPEIPLNTEQAAWVDQHLRAAGLRP